MISILRCQCRPRAGRGSVTGTSESPVTAERPAAQIPPMRRSFVFDIDDEDIDIEEPDITLKSSKKRTFEFDLSNSIVATPLVSCFDSNQCRVSCSQLQPDNLFVPSKTSRRSILDCIEGTNDHLPLRVSPNHRKNHASGNEDDSGREADFVDTWSISERDVHSHAHTSNNRLQYSFDHSPQIDTSLSRIHETRKGSKELECLRPPLPGPASSRFEIGEDIEDQNSPNAQCFDAPLRMRHLTISPTDPDFSSCSWKKMLQDLDIEPYTGFGLDILHNISHFNFWFFCYNCSQCFRCRRCGHSFAYCEAHDCADNSWVVPSKGISFHLRSTVQNYASFRLITFIVPCRHNDWLFS